MYLLPDETNNDKETTSNISDDIKQLLMKKNVIDISGNILNIPLYCHEITIVRDKKLEELRKIPVMNGRLIDQGIAHTLFDEINFLNNIMTHKKNFHTGLEYAIPRSYTKHIDKTVWQKVDRIRRKMLVAYRRRFR